MPTLSVFCGIVIQMFWQDHPPPHFHALAREWARGHRDELMEDWNLCRQRQPPKTIEPLR